METIQNPILPGFHPDPSIIRVGGDYYIATSTFEWYPGVAIHHSRDLRNWRLAGHALDRLSQLDLRGVGDNMGVWAPCLSYCDGVYYLVYSHVRTMNSMQKDCYNYLVTARDIAGPWSEPVLLKGNFADYSLFHDEAEGKKWLVFPTDYADEGLTGAGIAIQEYLPESQSLAGPVIGIYPGTALGTTEGPHLYHIGGWYYLIAAEGGTSYGHAVTVARSKSLAGPFETDPQNPMLTARDAPNAPLQKAGHADIVETAEGQWYMVHLCARPGPLGGKCILGRETAIQKITWNADGWPRLSCGGTTPQTQTLAPGRLVAQPWPAAPLREMFDGEALPAHWQTLRCPLPKTVMNLTERPGFLRLYGCESLGSLHEKALVARRQQHFCYQAATCVEFEPASPLQAAGLLCYYNTYAYYFLRVSCRPGLGKCIDILCGVNEELTVASEPVSAAGQTRCWLKVAVDRRALQFYYSFDGEGGGEGGWRPIGPVLDATVLTDEFEHPGMMNFTGAFVGLHCQDLGGKNLHADFDFFEYRPLDTPTGQEHEEATC